MGLVSSAIRQFYSIINNLFFQFFFFNGLQFKITSDGLIELYYMVIISQLPYNLKIRFKPITYGINSFLHTVAKLVMVQWCSCQ